MIRLSSTYLGLALGEKSIACGELSVNGDQRTIRRTATFSLPAEFSFEKPEAAGQMLASFLRQHRFRGSRAVVGVPARWLLAIERDVPPADLEQTRSMLRMHAERLAVSEHGEMVFDYTGRLTRGGGKILLVGILRQQLERIEAVLESAGLSVVAVTPTSLVVASALKEPTDQPMLVLGVQGAELVLQQGGEPRLLRHVPAPSLNGHGTPAIAPLSSELRRTVSLAPGDVGGSARELVLLDSVGLSKQQVDELAQRMGMPVQNRAGLASLGLQGGGPGEAAGAEQFVPVLALALAGTRHGVLPLDFRRSRLVPPRKKRLSRRSVWAVALAATAVIGIGSLCLDMRSRQSTLEDMKARYDSKQGELGEAEKMLDRFKYARGYFDERPAVLDCLRQITMAFNDDDQVWVTSLSLHDSGKGQFIGKAVDQRTILSLCGRLQKNPRFADARTLQIAEVNAPGGKFKEQSFTIGFTFLGGE